jgi:hypothetical protein
VQAADNSSENNPPMKRFLHENGLSITMLGLFVIFQVGLFFVGKHQYNQEQAEHGQSQVDYLEYLASASFWEATSENWESEFLQMAAYVFLTAFLFQRGSAESKKLDEEEAVDRDPRLARNKKDAPWPVRKGGFVLVLYEHSLTLVFLLLFIASFVAHVISGAIEYSNQQVAHGQEPTTPWGYLGTSQLWFESLQNWQSEFLAIGMMVLLSVFLRQRGSPESKPVEWSHYETGNG